MKFILSFFLLISLSVRISAQSSEIITSDIDHFWEAYDNIQTTTDSLQQMSYLEEYFFNRGTEGLTAIMQVRRYRPEEYLHALKAYPKYWESIRENTQNTHAYKVEIQKGIEAIKGLYSNYKPAKVYFEIGVFRTSGTALDSLVLIGAELAMSNAQTDVSELPESMDYVKRYAQLNPIDNLAFLNVHEFVHTQQNAPWAYDLLSQSIFEGAAEFLAELATEQASTQPAFAYGREHEATLKAAFAAEMFSPWYYNWLYNSTQNQFNTRDLGYFMGHAIVKNHYDNATDKKQAIETIVELDYTNRDSIENFVERTRYFSKPLAHYKDLYEESRPTITGFSGIRDGERSVSASLTQFTVHFSEAMDTRFRSTDFGPMGKDHFPEIKEIVFSEDGKSATYHIVLRPDTEYEMKIEAGYRTPRALPLQPYLLRFTTTK